MSGIFGCKVDIDRGKLHAEEYWPLSISLMERDGSRSNISVNESGHVFFQGEGSNAEIAARVIIGTLGELGELNGEAKSALKSVFLAIPKKAKK